MTESEFGQWVIKIGYLLLAARGAIVGVFLWRYAGVPDNRILKPLFWYAVIAFAIAVFESSFIGIVNTFPDFFVPYLTKFEIDDTFFISPLYYLNEFWFLGLFFSRIVHGREGRFIGIAAVCFFILEIVNTVFFEGYKDAQKIGSFCLALYLIVVSVLFFKQHFINKVGNSLSTDALNLIVWGFFCINTFSILILFFSDRLYNDLPSLFYQISMGRMAIEIFGLLLIAYGIRLFKVS
jgi:hypothetical protein